MTSLRRLAVVSTVVGAVAAFSGTLWGYPDSPKPDETIKSGSKTIAPAANQSLGEDLAATKFATRKVVSYRTRGGDLLAALQLKPTLAPMPARPRDIVFLVDTSASQVGGPLANAGILIDEFIKDARADDRISLWTANIPAATKDLTRGFHDPKSDRVKDALNELKSEVPLGDTDLANAIEKSAASFKVDPARQRVVVFLGDGMSIHQPLSAMTRAKLGADMVKNEVAFYSVPLGPNLDPRNLHGLACGTGGTVIRILPADKPADTKQRLLTAMSTPVLYPTAYQVSGANVAECFPTKLPPLRSDVPTLVVARVNDGKNLTLKIDGKLGGKEMQAEITEAVATPEFDNFFLVGMFEQWKNAKDQPALTQADRALAYAEMVNTLARTEFLAQAHEALAHKKFDAAAKLFGQAKELDPNDVEADAGAKVAEKLKEGKLTLEQMRKQQSSKDADTNAASKKNLVVRLAQEDKPAPAPDQPVDPKELLRRQQLAQQIEDQRVTQETNSAINEARRALRSDPEGSRERLKFLLSNVRENFDISDELRRRLVSQLESTLRFVEVEGARIQRDQVERLAVLARSEAIQTRLAQRRAVEDQTQQRMLRFAELMRTGRYEDGFRMTIAMGQDLIDQGMSVPAAVTAAGEWSLAAHHYREAERLRFLKEERYLATMLEVEKAAVPFPDEPPMVYPPTARWREITRLRKEKYESTGIADDDPNVIRKIRELRNKLMAPYSMRDKIDGPLGDALTYLATDTGIPILIDDQAFSLDLENKDVRGAPVKLDKLTGISLGTILRLLLAQVQGTYIIRREFVEVTTGQAQIREKTIRVYDVADLVIPIPNAINQAGVNQAIQNSILGGNASPFGGALNQFAGGIGGLGALGFGGGGLGLGALGFGGIQFGGLQPIAGAAGAAGFGGGGGVLGGQGGPANLGVQGGGFVGFAGFGGQLGQLGNLGGQFGLQGGDQSQILITLITQVVGTAADWSPLGAFQRPAVGVEGQLGGPLTDPGIQGDPLTAGALGYYPPSRALVVKATSRVHTRLGGGLGGGRVGPPPMGALDKKREEQFGKATDLDKNPFDKKDKAVAVKDKTDAKPVTDLDAKKIWQGALARGVNDPGLIIACADYLGERGKFDHAAEFLKANLRRAIVARPWVYEALTIALKECKGSLTDIERAQLSVIDLHPQDASGYLKAAEDMREAGRWDRAVAFCRQAAELQPNLPDPYLEAARAAELGKDSEAMAWAAGNLLSRDWPVDDQDVHRQAAERLNGLTTAYKSQNRADDAERVTDLIDRQRHRDLVIELIWSGDADLDLEVKEPIGTTCSFTNRQTPGGGILVGDHLLERSRETYKAAQAFPGEYRVTVRRIWGQPLGNKVTLKITENQGSPRESVRQETIVIDRSHALTVNVAGGRRSAVAQVPPTQARPRNLTVQNNGGDTLSRLRNLADPTFEINTGMKGGLASSGNPVEAKQPLGLPRKENAPVAYQTRVASVANGMDMIAKVTVMPDGRPGWSVSPVYETASRLQAKPIVNLPLIPGGREGGG